MVLKTSESQRSATNDGGQRKGAPSMDESSAPSVAALARKPALKPKNHLNSKLMKRLQAAEAAERALDPSAPDWQLGCTYFPAWMTYDDHQRPHEREDVMCG